MVDGRLGGLTQLVFHLVRLRVAHRGQAGLQVGQTLRVAGFQALAPHMLEQLLALVAVGQALGITGQRQTQQRHRVERMAGGHAQRAVLLLRQPQHLAVGPSAFVFDFSRAQLTVVLQHRAKQNGLVSHLVAQALQGFGQGAKCQVGIRADEVQVKSELVHGQGC